PRRLPGPDLRRDRRRPARTRPDHVRPPADRHPDPARRPRRQPRGGAMIFDGVVVATALPFDGDLRVDLDRYAEHCRWLIDNGCHGVGPNGSLGEYSSLTDEERRSVARTAIDTVGDDGIVVVGVHAPGSHQAKRWAELAAEDGADGLLCLPPTMYRA